MHPVAMSMTILAQSSRNPAPGSDRITIVSQSNLQAASPPAYGDSLRSTWYHGRDPPKGQV